MSIQRILVPTDLSPPATRAAHYAADLAHATGAQLELLHVCDEPCTHYHLSWAPNGLQVDEVSDTEDAVTRLQRLAARLSARGIAIQATVTRPVGVIRGILDASQHADLIVLASQEQADRQLVPHSISLSVAHRAPCPVLLVNADASSPTAGWRVLVPTDLSEASAEALRLARDLTASLGGAVEVVHALPDSAEAASWGGEAVEADDELPDARRLRYVERFVEAAGGAAVPLDIRLVEGAPVEAIARVVEEEHPDLVVVGRPPNRPDAPDRLLAAMTTVAPCPALRAPIPSAFLPCSPSPHLRMVLVP